MKKIINGHFLADDRQSLIGLLSCGGERLAESDVGLWVRYNQKEPPHGQDENPGWRLFSDFTLPISPESDPGVINRQARSWIGLLHFIKPQSGRLSLYAAMQLNP